MKYLIKIIIAIQLILITFLIDLIQNFCTFIWDFKFRKIELRLTKQLIKIIEKYL
jgi:hypothetical protein